jgi:hypothetical protein
MTYVADPPTRKQTLGHYRSYELAQADVDKLADHKFPVEHVAIVGSDLRLVELVTGRWTAGRATLDGAATGAWFGILVGLVFWIVSPWALGAVVSGAILGLAFGAIFGVVSHGLTGDQRDFASTSRIEAARYDVLVDEAYLNEAIAVLNGGLDRPPSRASAASHGKGMK